VRLTFALLLDDAGPLYAAAAPLAPLADAYCLEPGGALAHVTLAQFAGMDEEAARAAPFLGRAAAVHPGAPYLWPGRGRHAGRTWAGVAVEATAELRALRAQAVAFLAAHGATCLTPDPWAPHITLARLAAPPARGPVPVALPRSLPAVVALGGCGPQGQFLGRIPCAMTGS
jgi:2'-5' RNA ligase